MTVYFNKLHKLIMHDLFENSAKALDSVIMWYCCKVSYKIEMSHIFSDEQMLMYVLIVRCA